MAAPIAYRIPKNVNKTIIYNFAISRNIPIDSRFVIDSIATLGTEIPVKRRYPGLMFFAENEEDIYIFRKNMLSPILLTDLISGSTVQQVNLLELVDYTNLFAKLNSIGAKPGAIVNISPIEVSFIFDGTKWRYLSGDYKFATQELYDALSIELKQSNCVVLLGGIKHIINSDGTISPEVIVITEILTTTVLQPNRYYLLNGILNYSIGGKLHRIGSQLKLVKNFNLTNNITITHDFNSPYVRGFFRIISENPNINNHITDLSIQNIDDNSVTIESLATSIKGDLIIYTNV